MIAYEIHRMDADRHEFHVRMTISGIQDEMVYLRLPAWIPGSYMVRDFARNITTISAFDENGSVDLNSLDKQTWEVSGVSGELRVDYRVYAFDISVRTAYLDRQRAFFNGSSLFLYVDGRRNEPWSLVCKKPDFDWSVDWEVATTLPIADVDERGFGAYAGAGYDSLIDHPVEISRLRQLSFTVSDVPHRMVVTDAWEFDSARIERDLAPICAEHVALFGSLPVDQYLFQVLATADGYGGLEHRDSTSLVCKHTDLPGVGLKDPDKSYRQFLGLCSHEYFHLWNVKRIKPARLASSDLSSEAYTELLWAFEGITSYYDDLALLRSRVVPEHDYFELLANIITRVARTPARLLQSAAESSFYAWTKFYKQDENAPNAVVSYYAKGALIAFGLDVTIRLRSADRFSLDDLMRLLWREYGQTETGIKEREIETILETLVGHSFEDFFSDYVYGVEELPLGDWCAAMGLGFRLRAATGADDNGGCRVIAPDVEATPAFGAKLEEQPSGCTVMQVFAGGAAQRAGISPGDVLVAVDGMRPSLTGLPELLKRTPGESVVVHYFRRDRLHATALPLLPAEADTCDLWLLADEEIESDVALRRSSWKQSLAHPRC